MGGRAEGVIETTAGRVFVPYTLPGEQVRFAHQGERGQLLEIVAPSAERISPHCPAFGRCGGCQIQHWQTRPYTQWKRGLVVEALARFGLETEIAPLADVHGAGRRRATLFTDGEAAGYHALRSHELVPIDLCPILTPALAGAPVLTARLGQRFGPADVAFTETEQGLDIAVRPKSVRAPDRTDRAALAQLARDHSVARITLGNEILVQLSPVTLAIGDAVVDLPPQSFLQATAFAEQALADAVLDGLHRARRVADFFCGIGPFALRIAERAQIMAIDNNSAAVTALDKALKATPGLKYLGTQTRDLFADPLVPQELARFDAVVFDPPRAGAKGQAAELARSRVPRVMAVSCDPQSFARDARVLVEGGYRLDWVRPFDQFRHSAHVELVAQFTLHR